MEQVKAPLGRPASMARGFVPPGKGMGPQVWMAPVPAPVPYSFTDPAVALDDLTDRVDGVSGAILASVDGFGLARSSSMTDEPAHAAMLAAAVGLAHQLVSMGGGDRLRQLVVDHDAGIMLVWPIGTQRVLAVLASSRVDQRTLRTAVQDRLASLTDGTP